MTESLRAVLIPLSILALSIALGLVGWLLRQIYRGIQERFDRLETHFNDSQQRLEERITRTDSDLADLKANLSRLYVMRDDFIRTTINLERKIDEMMADIKRWLICPQLHNRLPGEACYAQPPGPKPDPAGRDFAGPLPEPPLPGGR